MYILYGVVETGLACNHVATLLLCQAMHGVTILLLFVCMDG